MVRCNFCRKKCAMPFDCKYCEKEFCAKCRLQETHECPNIAEMKTAKQQLLEQTLMLQKTETCKVVKF